MSDCHIVSGACALTVKPESTPVEVSRLPTDGEGLLRLIGLEIGVIVGDADAYEGMGCAMMRGTAEAGVLKSASRRRESQITARAKYRR